VDLVHVHALFRRLAGGIEEYHEEPQSARDFPAQTACGVVCFHARTCEQRTECKVWLISPEVYEFVNPLKPSGHYMYHPL
jgi:hypothetical protein